MKTRIQREGSGLAAPDSAASVAIHWHGAHEYRRELSEWTFQRVADNVLRRGSQRQLGVTPVSWMPTQVATALREAVHEYLGEYLRSYRQEFILNTVVRRLQRQEERHAALAAQFDKLAMELRHWQAVGEPLKVPETAPSVEDHYDEIGQAVSDTLTALGVHGTIDLEDSVISVSIPDPGSVSEFDVYRGVAQRLPISLYQRLTFDIDFG